LWRLLWCFSRETHGSPKLAYTTPEVHSQISMNPKETGAVPMFNVKRNLLCVIAGLFLMSVSARPSSAQVSTWNLDPEHTLARFAVKHMMIETVRGSFNKLSGSVQYDPNDVTKTVIQATIQTDSEESGSAGRDKDVKSPNFLDVEKFPTITFQSKRAEAVGNGHTKVTGDLTIHGVTKEVVLDVDGPSKPLKVGKLVHVGASTALTINRKDYGMVYNRVLDNGGVMVSDEVAITLDIDMTQPAPAPAGGK
jgi:polyisoprenoid-binding protein YceI